MKRPTASLRAAPLRVVLVGKVNGRGGQEFRLCCHMAGTSTAVWSKRHGWTAALVDRLVSLVRRGGLELRGKRPSQRTLERALSAARATLKNAKATAHAQAPVPAPAAAAGQHAAAVDHPAAVGHAVNDGPAAAPEHRLPRVHERCYVPHHLWPQEASGATPYGAGWLATVVAVVEHGVRFRCDGEADAVSLKPRAFVEHCAVLGSSDPSVWGLLDRDALHCVFACCGLSTLLAFEASHRAALLAVRACWRDEWHHTELPGVTRDALCLAVEGQVVVVGGGTYDSRGQAAARLRFDQPGECLLRVGESTFHIDTPEPVRAVAVHAATARVAIAHRHIQVLRADTSKWRQLETHLMTAAVLAWRGDVLLAAAGGAVFSLGSAQSQPTVECGYSGGVTALAATNDLMVAGYRSGVVVRKVHDSIRCLRDVCYTVTHAVAVRGRMVAAVHGRKVDVWFGLHPIATLHCMGQVSALHLSSNYCIWVGVGARGVIEVWHDLRRAGRRVGMLGGHGGALTGIGLDAEGRIVSSSLASRAGVRALWRSRAPVSAWV